MAQCNEELTSICPDSIDLDAAPVAKLLHGGPKVLVERLEDHAQVVFVIKATEKPNAVLPILGVGFAQSCERGDFLLASSAHHLVVALHLDRHLGRWRKYQAGGELRAHRAGRSLRAK
eukprot:scaffold265146_cov29-Tisochrysis_lutea.AAC.2